MLCPVIPFFLTRLDDTNSIHFAFHILVHVHKGKGMNTSGQFNEKRLPEHDYNEPGTYHLLLELAENAGALGRLCKGAMQLSRFGELFLSILSIALQTFSCLRVDAMDVRPHCVEMVVTITRHRKPICSLFKKFCERWKYRRTMTISLFVGYLKMNSGRLINTDRGVSGEHFWKLGFKDRVLTDEKEIELLCAKLNTRFHRMRYSEWTAPDADSVVSLSSVLESGLAAAFGSFFSGTTMLSGCIETPVQLYDSMLLGRALFLNNSLLRPLPAEDEADSDEGVSITSASGGRAGIPLIWSVGPGRIFLSMPSGS